MPPNFKRKGVKVRVGEKKWTKLKTFAIKEGGFISNSWFHLFLVRNCKKSYCTMLISKIIDHVESLKVPFLEIGQGRRRRTEEEKEEIIWRRKK